MDNLKEEIHNPFTFSDFIDKLTIVSKKDLCKMPAAKQELEEMMNWMKDRGIDAEFILAIIRIAQTNMDIWHLEHSVRNAAEGSIPLSEVGRRAIMIRNSNKARIENKNILNMGKSRIEEKLHHLSEDTYDKFYKNAGIDIEFKTREEGGIE